MYFVGVCDNKNLFLSCDVASTTSFPVEGVSRNLLDQSCASGSLSVSCASIFSQRDNIVCTQN